MERIVTMVMQQVIRQLVNRGMSAGIDKMTRGKADVPPDQQAASRQTADRAKGAMRLLRRFGRF